jgi:hypothetical protein
MRNVKRYSLLVLAGMALFVATAAVSCSGNTHQSAPAGATDHTPAQVIQMPSGFRNVAVKCVNVQGMWFAVASVSDGGNNDNKDGAVSLTADPKCSHYGP